MKKIKLIILLSILPAILFTTIFLVVLLSPLMIFSGEVVSADYGSDIFYGAELNGYTFTFSKDAFFHFPFIPEGKITISSGFGYRYLYGKREFHNALDFPIPEGTPILAAEDGVVIQAGRNGGYGNLVIIEHEGIYSTRYAHLSSVAVSEGDMVKRGQVIAYSGNTGRSTGPHLHFEVRVNNLAVNPADYISLMPEIPEINAKDIVFKEVPIDFINYNLSMLNFNNNITNVLLNECKEKNINPILMVAIINNLNTISTENQVIELIQNVKSLLNERPSVINPLLWLNQLQDQDYWWMAVAKDFNKLSQ